MRILFVNNKYDYGRHDQGYSYEHYNFYDTLINMGHDITYFDVASLMQKYGKKQMNSMLFKVAKNNDYNLMFTVLFSNELDKKVVKKISLKTDITTFNWFCDDHWRFDNYSRYWAPCFNWVTTTARSALLKYYKIGYKNVIKTQWACNQYLYKNLNLPLSYDVTFIGQPHGNRKQVIQSLIDVGIRVNTWGKGWESGRISQDDMIKVFNKSRINLNLSNASVSLPGPSILNNTPARLISKCLDSVPYGDKIRHAGRSIATGNKSSGNAGNAESYFEQIKGRNFEVPGCGGFMLTGNVEDLDSYYKIGQEIICFADEKDLAAKVRYYLDNEGERAAIARAGFQRTLKEHTYVHRFSEIFDRMGLQSLSADEILQGNGRVGRTDEIL